MVKRQREEQPATASQSGDDDSNSDQWMDYLDLDGGEEAAVDDDRNLEPPEKDAQAATASQSGDDSNSDHWMDYLDLDGGEETEEVDDDRNLAPPEKDAEAVKVDGDRITALQEKARVRILDFLPIKSVILMGSLSKRWREMYSLYWRGVAVDVKLPSDGDALSKLEERAEQEPKRRLRYFSLLVEGTTTVKYFKSCLKHAGECSPEVIHIGDQRQNPKWKHKFHVNETSQQLVRLSLIGVAFANFQNKRLDGVSFPMLEEIHIKACQFNRTGYVDLKNLVGLCPNLRVLDVRDCKTIWEINVEQSGEHLMSLTVMDCPLNRRLTAGQHLRRLRSFRYRANFVEYGFTLPDNDSLTDLFISIPQYQSTLGRKNSFKRLPDLSNLTFLTLCSTSLRALTLAGNTIQTSLRSLRELQLLMFELEPINLSDVREFLNTCGYYPQLTKLFVQLPETDSKITQNTSSENVEGEQQDGFEKLDVVKMTNFKYDWNEIQLLQFLFQKAKLLQKLILVRPKPVPADRVLRLQVPANVQSSHFIQNSLPRRRSSPFRPSPLPLNNSFKDFPGLSNLTALTLCKASLRAMCVSLLSNANQEILTSLRGLQLIMSELEPDNLRNICAFLNTCLHPQLDRLFVQDSVTLPEQETRSVQKGIAEMVQGKQQDGLEKLDVVKMAIFKYDWNEIQLLQFLFNKRLRLILFFSAAAAAIQGCSRRCGGLVVPYPFGFSGSCPILLSYNDGDNKSTAALLRPTNATTTDHSYTVVSFNSTTPPPPPSPSRRPANAPYGISSSTSLFLRDRQNATSAICSIPVEPMRRSTPSHRGGGGGNETVSSSLTCIALVSPDPMAAESGVGMFTQWEKIEEPVCDKVMTSMYGGDSREREEQPATASQSGVDAGDDSNSDQWMDYLNLDGGEEAVEVDDDRNLAPLEKDAEVDDDRNLDQPAEKEVAAAKVDGDRIAALQEKARLRILDFLPIKSVILMGSLSKRWREIYSLYWRDVAVDVKLPTDGDALSKLKEREEQEPKRRLRYFSLLVVERKKVEREYFNSCLEYAGKCSPEVIHISDRREADRKFKMHLTSKQLVRLSLIGVTFSHFQGKLCEGVSFPTLEEIHIKNSVINQMTDLKNLVGACTILRVLDLRGCKSITHIDVETAGEHLMSLTVMDCDRVRRLTAGNHLRSFRYSGNFLRLLSLPDNDSLTDLFIGFPGSQSTPGPENSFKRLPDLSNLTFLTLCSTSLRAVTMAGNTIQTSLRSLRELQLLMFKLEPINLSDVREFLNTCGYYPQLTKLFVQLPETDSKITQNTSSENVEGEQQDGFEKLDVVKMTNFKYDWNEIQLLQFLFQKAKLLQKLILVRPKPVPADRVWRLQVPATVQEEEGPAAAPGWWVGGVDAVLGGRGGGPRRREQWSTRMATRARVELTSGRTVKAWTTLPQTTAGLENWGKAPVNEVGPKQHQACETNRKRLAFWPRLFLPIRNPNQAQWLLGVSEKAEGERGAAGVTMKLTAVRAAGDGAPIRRRNRRHLQPGGAATSRRYGGGEAAKVVVDRIMALLLGLRSFRYSSTVAGAAVASRRRQEEREKQRGRSGGGERRAAAMPHKSGGVSGAGTISVPKTRLGYGGEAPPKMDRISALSKEARLRIMSFLPAKSVMLMGSISSGWRKLWREYWPEVSVTLALGHRNWEQQLGLLRQRRRGRGRRLLRFSLTIENGNDYSALKMEDVNFCIDYAADCSAEEIHIENIPRWRGLSFRFEQTSRQLVRLSLIGVEVFRLRRTGGLFPTLKEIRIHSTKLSDNNLCSIVSRCPNLRVLDLRRCDYINHIDFKCARAQPQLMSLTVAECPKVTDISAGKLGGLRSLLYTGGFLTSLYLPGKNSLADVCICFGCSGAPPLYNKWFKALPDLSNLTVLTLCSVFLRSVSIMRDAGNDVKLSNLRSLRELQLRMFGMKTINLSDIYGFLKTCRYPRLKMLFVHVITVAKSITLACAQTQLLLYYFLLMILSYILPLCFQLPAKGRDSYEDALKEVGEEEPPEESLQELAVVKMTNFKCHCNEIELVHFLFRKANFLQRLILVAPNPIWVYPEPEAGLLHLKKASATVQSGCNSHQTRVTITRSQFLH
uniref:At1g61320/AtMIF1 LRR domain-containing protein n=1 Tax=Oryza punctata TaxID=4537 RepID=A0A0E0LEV2_ORYPU